MNISTNQTMKIAYSVQEVAEQTTLSKGFVRNEIKDGHLKARRINRRVIVLHDDLLNYLTKGENNEQK